jgi:hypothetical protein
MTDNTVFDVCCLICDSVKRQQEELANAMRGQFPGK